MLHRMRLHVELSGSSPAIWRRLSVDPRLTLAQFHRVLQHAFDWEDCHLHEFRAADRTRYAIPSPYADDVENAERFVLRDVLAADAPLDYVYDFGDGWRHRVELEEMLTMDDADRRRLLELAGRTTKAAATTEPPAAVVEAGERAAPPEDCGGIWGYQELLELRAMPADERAKLDEWGRERLAWLEDHDPDAFDLEGINRRLARLRVTKAFAGR